MPRRITSLRRRAASDRNELTPERLEIFITGDFEHGALIPTRWDRRGCPFADMEHARKVYGLHREFVLKVHREGWREEYGRATLVVVHGHWRRDGLACWAEEQFGNARSSGTST